MTLYFCGRPVDVFGPCEDGWVWGVPHGRESPAWYWMLQLHATPWGA